MGPLSAQDHNSDGKRQKRENKCKNKMRSLSMFARFNYLEEGYSNFQLHFGSPTKEGKTMAGFRLFYLFIIISRRCGENTN